MGTPDSKEVIILSSISNEFRENESAKTIKGRIGLENPEVIHEYNRVMPGVDLNDQMKPRVLDGLINFKFSFLRNCVPIPLSKR